MPAAVTKNLHVPLEESLYRRLRAEAERANRPATELAREAIEQWLQARHRAAVHEAIVAYARAHAGSAADIDPDLEAAGLEQLDPENGA
jgi:predicted DNA-binding protein